MTPDAMRRLDATLGPPLCAALTLARATGLLRPPLQAGPPAAVRRLLFVKLAEMGATVLLPPTLERVRALWPGCQVYFLVFAENKGAVSLLGDFPAEQVITLDASDLWTFTRSLRGVLGQLRRLQLDVVVDLEFFSRAAAIITALSGAKATVGFSRYTLEGLYKGNLYSHPVQYNPHLHTAVSYITLIEALTQPAGQCPLVKVPPVAREDLRLPRFQPTLDEYARLTAKLQTANPRFTGVPGQRLVILNVNSSQLVPLRRWPLASFIALGQQLLSDPATLIVLTGTTSELQESLEVTRQVGPERVLNLVGQTNLRELLTLYSRCHLMVTNDSGPSHFAGLTDLPTITLFGPETPEVFGPLGAHKVAITAGLACSPCVSVFNHRKSPCNDNICMKSISVARVYAECQRLLAATALPTPPALTP